MQMRFIPYVKFKIYKSNKHGGWVGLAGGRGNIHWGNNMTLPFYGRMNLVSIQRAMATFQMSLMGNSSTGV